MTDDNSREIYLSGGMANSPPDATVNSDHREEGLNVKAVTDEFFSEYVTKVHSRMQTLYQDAHQVPEQQSHQLIATLEELRLAVEELHVAEEELITQNEQLVQAKQAVEFEHHRYQDLFDFAPDGYIVTNPEGIVKEVNQAAAALLGVAPQFLTNKPLSLYIPEPDRKAFRALVNQITSTQQVKGWELQIQGRHDKVATVSVTVKSVRAPAAAEASLRWQLRDISDLKQAQGAISQLQSQNLELLETDRLRSQFLANVSHELRTPMNAILGFSQMLIKQAQQKQDPKTLSMVERIFQNGRHLLALIEDMLSFSRLGTNSVELSPEQFELQGLITVTLEELRPLAEQKALSLQTELPPEPITVVNDRGRLRQIITNLVANAFKFTDVGGVVVSLRSLPQNRLQINVRDTGCGISAKDQPHVFQEFWQVHSARHQSQGTGLGLAITHALVQAMGGNITVQSELGRGSTFRVELPVEVEDGEG